MTSPNSQPIKVQKITHYITKNMRGRFVHHLDLSQPGTTLATDWLLKLVLCPSKIIFFYIIEMVPTPVLYFALVAFTTIRVL